MSTRDVQNLRESVACGIALSSLVAMTALPLASGACSEEVVVLATVSSAGSVPVGDRCVKSSDCEDGFFCDRHDCSSPAGTCETFPTECKDEELPVCGCDGVTYFNDCLRQAAGAVGARPDECGIAGLECDVTAENQCPDNTMCALLSGFSKPNSTCHGKSGRCWVLPATCPPPSHSDRWNSCDDDDPAHKCLNTCAAIRASQPSDAGPAAWYSRATMCE